MEALKQLLSPPPHVLDDEDRRLARLLHILLLGMLLTNAVAVPLTLFSKPVLLTLGIHLLVFALLVVLLVVLRSGSVRLACALIVLLMNLAGIGANILLDRPFSILSVLGILGLVVRGLQAKGRNVIVALVFSIGLAIVSGFVSLAPARTVGREWIVLFDAMVYLWASAFGGFLAYLSIGELRKALDGARVARQQLAEQNAELRDAIAHSESLRQQQENFTHKLREVVNAANDLMNCTTLDELWQVALGIAKDRIGLTRCSIFIFDPKNQQLCGTYGTNRFGEIIDEHGHTFALTETAILKSLQHFPQKDEASWEINPDVELKEWRDGQTVVLCRGWMANTMIRPKDGLPLAVFFNDVGLTGAPVEPEKQDLLAVLCSILGNVAERKRAELRQKQQAHGLREVMAAADELLRTRNLDEFWARAARLAQQRLGVERIRFYQLHDAATGAFHGTFGTDISKQVVDYSGDNWRSPELLADLRERHATTERLTWHLNEDQDLLDLIDGRFHSVAHGWVVSIPIFSSVGKLIGVLFNDSAITGAAVIPEQQDLLVAYASLLGSMAERRMADERQRQMTKGLREVLGCANALLAVTNLNEFWRRVVLLANERLGVERCSVYLSEPGSKRLHGTFGMDILRRVVDEHDVVFESQDYYDGTWSNRAERFGRVWNLTERGVHTTKTENGYRRLQEGWVVDTPIVAADGKVLGVFFNDTAISREPLDEDLQDIIAVYCTLLGNIFERKQIEQALHESNVLLGQRVEERTQQLRRSETYFRTLIQQSSDVITVISLDGTIHFESASSMRVFGHSGRIGKNIFELMHPDDTNIVAEAMVGVMNMDLLDDATFAVRVQRGDGTWADTESKVSLLYDDDQQVRGVVVNARDVTERKRLNDTIRESEVRFRRMADTSPILLVTLDAALQVEFANQAIRTLSGANVVGMRAQDVLQRFHPDDVQMITQTVLPSLAERASWNAEVRILTAQGEYRWINFTSAKRFDESGQFHGYIIAGMDVHDRKLAEDALKESEERFRTMADFTPVMIGVCDIDLRMEFVNQTFYKLTGLAPEQMLGFGWKNLLPSPEYATFIHQVALSTQPGQTSHMEIPVCLSDGREIYLLLSGQARSDRAGRIIGWIGTGTDITELKNTQRMLERQLSFERFLARWSEQLTQCAPEKLGAAIDRVLSEFGQFIDVQEAQVYIFSPTGTSRVEYEWIAPEHDSRPNRRLKHRDFLNSDSAWWYESASQEKMVALADVHDLPAEMSEVVDHLHAAGIVSILDLPIKINDLRIGQLDLDVIGTPRQWSEEDIRMSRLVANLIGHVLRQRYAAEELARRTAIQALMATVSNEFARLPVMQIESAINFALQHLGQTLNAAACHVLFFDHHAFGRNHLYEWCTPGQPSLYTVVPPHDVDLSDFDWLIDRLTQDGCVQWTLQHDVFAMIPRMKHALVQSRINAGLIVPISLENHYVGVLAVESDDPAKTWDENEIGVAKLIATHISSAYVRRQTHVALGQRVSFVQRVAEISAHFLNLPPNQIDQGIEFALKTLGEFTEIDICRLFQYNDDETTTTNTHEWCAAGIASQHSMLQNMPLEKESWWQRHLRAHGLIYFTSVRQMPAEAGVFLEGLIQRGIRSILTIALVHGDAFIGELGLDSLTEEHVWTDEDIRMLRLVGEIISNAVVRQRAYARLQAKIAAETLIATISFDFGRQPFYKIGEAVDNTLAALGAFAGCDFCSLYEIAEKQDIWANTHEWHTDHVASQLDLMQRRPFERDSWWWARLAKRENIIVQDVTTAGELPEVMRQDLMSRGIRSLLAIPILQNGILIGELGLDMVMQPRRWPADLIQIAELIADLMGNAIERRRNAHALQMERDLLEARVIDRTHELTKLLDVTKTVNATLELQPLLNLILDQLKGVVAYDALTISEFNEANSKVIIFEGPPMVRQLATDWAYDVERDVHITEMIVHRSTVIVADVLDDSLFALAARRRFNQLGNRLSDELLSLLYVPLIVRDRVIGMLALYSHTRNFYTEHHARLAMAFANQAAVAIENARLHEQAVQMAALGERGRLARELHDSVSQALFGIVLGARTVLQNGRKTNDSLVLEPMEYVLKLSEAALAEMRALIFELRPESLQQEGLLVAFQKQSEAICARHQIDVKADLGGVEPSTSLAVKEAIYRIGLEAIQNTIKHANATLIELKLHVLDEQVVLEVKDNGRGFDTRNKFPGHFGLYTMRERAEQFGGVLSLSSSPQEGTLIQVRIPLNRQRLSSNGQQAVAF